MAPEARPDTPTQAPAIAGSAESQTGAPTSQRRRPAPTRRGGTVSARAMEMQREERIRHDSIHDLRTIAVIAVVVIIALGAASIVL